MSNLMEAITVLVAVFGLACIIVWQVVLPVVGLLYLAGMLR